MTAMHSSNAYRTARQRWTRVAFIFIAAGGMAIAQETQQPQESKEQQEPITAVFKAHEVGFIYRSSTKFFACHELENRVANILLAAGARDDIQVRASNCSEALMPEDPTTSRANRWDRSNPLDRFRQPDPNRQQSAHVRVRVMMPVEATPDVIAEIEKDKSRRDLVSRVTGNPAAALNDPIVFAAQRQQVTLSHRTIRLEPEDCELLEHMMVGVFRELDVRVIRRSFACNPRQLSNIPPQLVIETLLPTGALLPMPDPQKKADPGGSGAPSDTPRDEPSEPATETPPQ